MKQKEHFIPIILVIILLVTNTSHPSNIRGALSFLLTPIYGLVNAPSNFYLWVKEQGQSKEVLLTQVQQLTHHNKALKVELQTHHAVMVELQKLKNIHNINYRNSKDNTILASVSSIAQSRLKKQLIINQGSSDGIKIGQAVIGTFGIVGQIIDISSNRSTVLNITDPNHYISVKSQRNSLRTIAQGVATHQHKLQLNFIPKDSDIKLGDVFVSSNLNKVFPKNHPVGVVSKIDNLDNVFISVELKPIEPIASLEFMLVMTNQNL